MRIKNLKYDPNHADKPRRAYNHLKYLDDVITIEKARRVEAYERAKYGKPVNVEVIEDPKRCIAECGQDVEGPLMPVVQQKEKPKRKYTKRNDPKG